MVPSVLIERQADEPTGAEIKSEHLLELSLTEYSACHSSAFNMHSGGTDIRPRSEYARSKSALIKANTSLANFRIRRSG